MYQTDVVSDQESIAAMIFPLITVHHAGIPRYSACTAATVKPALFSKTRDSSKSQRSCYESAVLFICPGMLGVTEVRGTSELLPSGALHVKTEYLKDGEWQPGREVTYKPDPDAKVIFK